MNTNIINVTLKAIRTNNTPSMTKRFQIDLNGYTGLLLEHFTPDSLVTNTIERVARDYQAQRAPGLSGVERSYGNRVSWIEVLQDIPMELWNKYGFYEVDAIDSLDYIVIRHHGNHIIVPSQFGHVDFMARTAGQYMWKQKHCKCRGKRNIFYVERIQNFQLEMMKKFSGCTRLEFYLNMVGEAVKLPKSFWD